MRRSRPAALLTSWSIHSREILKDRVRYEVAGRAVPFMVVFGTEPSADPGWKGDELCDAASVFCAELVFGRSLDELEGMMLLKRPHRFLPLSWDLGVSSAPVRG